MNITKEEFETLYAEFKEKERLEMEEEKAKRNKPKTYLKLAHDYFMTMRRSNYVSIDNYCLIRQLVCHAYGCSRVSEMPMDKKDEANKLAIELIDKFYETYLKYLKEKKESE